MKYFSLFFTNVILENTVINEIFHLKYFIGTSLSVGRYYRLTQEDDSRLCIAIWSVSTIELLNKRILSSMISTPWLMLQLLADQVTVMILPFDLRAA